MRKKAPHEVDLGSLILPERSSGIDYGLPPSQLDAVDKHYRAVLIKHISAWVRHAGTWPVKRWRSLMFTADLTGVLTATCWVAFPAWLLQAQDLEHCIRPIEKQYPAAADLRRQLLYLDPLARSIAAQALQHAWFHQT